MSRSKDTLAVVLTYTGILGVAYAIFGLLEPTPLVLEYPTGPEAPPPPPPGPSPGPVGPQQLLGSTVHVYPGRVYAASVNVSFPLSTLASAAKVKAYAEKQGFTNVTVTEDNRPLGSPFLAPEADYYVHGVYTGSVAKSFSRTNGPVTLVETWQV